MYQPGSSTALTDVQPQVEIRPTSEGEEPLRHLVVFVLVAIAAAAVPFAASVATSGAVNSLTWFAFCIAAAAAVMGGIACLLRAGDWAFQRARRSARSD
ncbi:MAG TPA: hypothetical protein VG078_05115 [Acidimicrobiales bacterium]|nr:hypothetical protein [Acidimicrobiales bacterium]